MAPDLIVDLSLHKTLGIAGIQSKLPYGRRPDDWSKPFWITRQHNGNPIVCHRLHSNHSLRLRRLARLINEDMRKKCPVTLYPNIEEHRRGYTRRYYLLELVDPLAVGHAIMLRLRECVWLEVGGNGDLESE